MAARLSWIVLGAAALLLGGMQSWRLFSARETKTVAAVQPAEEGTASPSLLLLRERVERRQGLEVQLRRAMEEGELERALALSARLIDFDPIHREARSLALEAQRELELRGLYIEAEGLLDQGKGEEALRKLFAIPPGSETYARARLLALRLLPGVAGRARSDCLGLHRAGRLREAAARCRFYLDLRCHQQVEEAIRERLRVLERALAARESWSCPAKWSAWWGEEGQGAERIEVARFDDPALAAAIERWAAGGSAEAALGQLRRAGREGETAEWSDAIRLSEARLREGQSALLAGKLEEAEARLLAAASAERGLLREGQRSRRLVEASSALAQAFLHQGKEQAAKRRWEAAARSFERGLVADPQNLELRAAIHQLREEQDER